MERKEILESLDEDTKSSIAQALWMPEFRADKIPAEIKAKLADPKSSSQAYGKYLKVHIEWLLGHPQSYNPDYRKRYELLLEYCDKISPHQAYVMSQKFFGLDVSQGYEPMPSQASLQFPRDHQPKLKHQVGWHFFVGSCWDEDGQEYGVELMFFRVALLPPDLAKSLDLTDIENQIVETQFAISKAGKKHYQAEPIVISGTSGLLGYNTDPFSYYVGKNTIQSHKKGKFFPLSVLAWGIDKGTKPQTEIWADLTFTSGKEYLYQGDGGCMPCVDGMGTLYYSTPNITLDPTKSSLSIGGKKVRLKKGIFWFDHQWGFLGGNPQSRVLRASNNISKPTPAGWDWFMAQFVGDRQLTMFAPHSKAYKKYYFQTGSTPPETMTIDVAGKYFSETKELKNTWGTLEISEWIKSEDSPNPIKYPITHTWHPNKWHFRFDDQMPKDIREFIMTPIVPQAQTLFFANGSQYAEGAVYLTNKAGGDIGRGFAESVQYADTTENMLRLAGLPTAPKIIDNLKPQGSSLMSRFSSLCYMLMHQKDLKKVLGNAKGLEFFAKPKQKKQHVPRH